MTKRILRLEINEDEDNGLFIDVLENDYNFIKDTIYNEDLAKLIIDKINENLGV